MKASTIFITMLTISFLILYGNARGQSDRIHWIGFEELDNRFDQDPKRVLIYFYTDWCTYCRKMDKEVFIKHEVVNLINQEFWAIKFDGESIEKIRFDGLVFENNNPQNKFQRGIHELTELLALNNGQFTPPAILIFDDEFNLKSRHFEYMPAKKLLDLLN